MTITSPENSRLEVTAHIAELTKNAIMEALNADFENEPVLDVKSTIEMLRKSSDRWQKHSNDLAAENDRAHEILSRCENEMRYAGWTQYENDNPQRNGIYEQVAAFIKVVPGYVKHWQLTGSTTNNKGG